jgi:hypothetical protein
MQRKSTKSSFTFYLRIAENVSVIFYLKQISIRIIYLDRVKLGWINQKGNLLLSEYKKLKSYCCSHLLSRY